MDQNAKRNALVNYLLNTQGIHDPQKVDEVIQQMADVLLPETAIAKGLTATIDKAYEQMLIETGASTGAAGAPANPTETKAPTTVQPQAMTTADTAAIRNSLLNSQAQRKVASESTMIEGYVFSKPGLDTLLAAGTTGIIDQKNWNEKLAGLEAQVCDDDDNCKSKTNFATLKAAAAAGTPVEVYRSGMSKKVIAYFIRKATATGAGVSSELMKANDVKNFLTLHCYGCIKPVAESKNPGVRLRTKKVTNNPAAGVVSKVIMVDLAKKEAMERTDFINFAYVADTAVPAKSTNCKSELCFKVKEVKNGVEKIVTKRALVKTSVPAMSIKDPRFTILEKKSANDFSGEFSDEQLASLSLALEASNAELYRALTGSDGAVVQSHLDDADVAMLKSIFESSSQAPGGVTV